MTALRLVHSRPDGEAFADDAALVAALLAEDPRARALLFDQHAAYLRRVIARVLGVDDELPEVLQETFLQAFRSIHTLDDPERLGAWLVRVAVFTARGVIRKRQRRRWLQFVPPAEVPEVESRHADPDARRTLDRFQSVLEQLPADERIAFALRFVEGLELTEVADACDCSLATIKRRLTRAETRFVSLASDDPLLSKWIRQSPRWSRP